MQPPTPFTNTDLPRIDNPHLRKLASALLAANVPFVVEDNSDPLIQDDALDILVTTPEGNSLSVGSPNEYSPYTTPYYRLSIDLKAKQAISHGLETNDPVAMVEAITKEQQGN